MTIQEFIKVTSKNLKDYSTRPKIVCNDSFEMSVQASSGHYCEPRNLSDYYSKMEIGFPSKIEPLILQYEEDSAAPKNTVYGWVPIDIIQSVIDNHGGINVPVTFKDLKEIQEPLNLLN